MISLRRGIAGSASSARPACELSSAERSGRLNQLEPLANPTIQGVGDWFQIRYEQLQQVVARDNRLLGMRNSEPFV